jgi:hypothetical protein
MEECQEKLTQDRPGKAVKKQKVPHFCAPPIRNGISPDTLNFVLAVQGYLAVTCGKTYTST